MGTSERYSKVSRRIWNDATFRDRISKMPPSGQGLFLRLLTAPESTVLPGVIPVREAGLAESLGWDLKGLREGFGELFREGIAKADFGAGLVWLPNAIRHNRPDNPNMVLGWAKEWSELPECPLKDEALQAFAEFIKGLGEPYAQALANSWPNPSETVTPTLGGTKSKSKSKIFKIPPKPPQGGKPDPNTPEAPKAKTAKTRRGRPPSRRTRLPEGWKPDDELRAWCREKGLTDSQVESQVERFLGYWQGEGKPKADWRATFRNWVLKALAEGWLKAQPKSAPTQSRPVLDPKQYLTDPEYLYADAATQEAIRQRARREAEELALEQKL